MPLRQRGNTSPERGDPSPSLAVEFATPSQPQLHRVFQPLVVHARAPVNRTQHGHRLVRRGPAALLGEVIESRLHVLARNAIQGSVHPVGQINSQVLPINLHGHGCPARIGLQVLIERCLQRRQTPRPCPLIGRIPARGDAPEQCLGLPAGLVRGDAPEAPGHDTLVGRVAPAAIGPVVDQERLGARRLNPDSEAREFIVPGDPRFGRRFKSVHASFGQRQADLSGAFSFACFHAKRIANRPAMSTEKSTLEI